MPVNTGVGRLESPVTEGALDWDNRIGGTVGLGVTTADVGDEEIGRLLVTDNEGWIGLRKPSVLLFRLIMLVSSFLNLSRSATAVCGDVKVKLCPLSSPTRPIFSLTCAAPSLLQKRAVR